MQKYLQVYFKKLDWTSEEADEPDEIEQDEYTEDCEWDQDRSPVDIAIATMEDQGFIHTSSSSFHEGVWYTVNQEQDYYDGTYPVYDFFPKGFSEAEQKEIFNHFHRRQ